MLKLREFVPNNAGHIWQEVCPDGDVVLVGLAAKWRATVAPWISTMPTRILTWERDEFNFSVGMIAKSDEDTALRIYGAMWKSWEDSEYLGRETAQLEPLELKGPVNPDRLVPALDNIKKRLGIGNQIFTQTSSGVYIVNSRLKKKDLPFLRS